MDCPPRKKRNSEVLIFPFILIHEHDNVYLDEHPKEPAYTMTLVFPMNFQLNAKHKVIEDFTWSDPKKLRLFSLFNLTQNVGPSTIPMYFHSCCSNLAPHYFHK